MKKINNNDYYQLDTICSLLYSKQYNKAESQLILLIEKVVDLATENCKENAELIDIHNILYSSFNQYFLDWHKRNNVSIASFAHHHNYLLTQCSLPAEIDDLLFELGTYLGDNTHREQKKEVLYHLECYQNKLSS